MIGQELLQSFLNDESGIEGWFYPADILSLAAIDSIQVAMGGCGDRSAKWGFTRENRWCSSAI